MSYKSPADFVTEAVRGKCEELKILAATSELPDLEHFNISENGIRILDRTIISTTSRGRIIDVYFKPEKVWCEHCDATNCRHVKFAMNISGVQKILQEKGWKIKE
jgi:hypothetical protein